MSYLIPTLVGGLIAGTLDIIYAMIMAWYGRKVKPLQLLQFISTGLLGKRAYIQGKSAAIKGLIFHYIMTIVMALVFVIAARQFPILLTYPLLSGMIYGVIIFITMMYIVIPLSQTFPKSKPKGIQLALELCAHMFLVGTPIVYSAIYF